MYRSVPTTAMPASPEATSRESMAAGPTANCREVPNRAYTTLGHQRGIEAIDDRETRNGGIGHALRDEQDPNGQPGRQVAGEVLAPVAREPIKERNP